MLEVALFGCCLTGKTLTHAKYDGNHREEMSLCACISSQECEPQQTQTSQRRVGLTRRFLILVQLYL